MTKLKKNLRALPLAALCLLVLGGAAALAQRQLKSAVTSLDLGKLESMKDVGVTP